VFFFFKPLYRTSLIVKSVSGEPTRVAKKKLADELRLEKKRIKLARREGQRVLEAEIKEQRRRRQEVDDMEFMGLILSDII